MHGSAAFGAEGVEEGVPSAWVSLLNNGEGVLEAAKKLVDLRAQLL